MIIFNVSSPLDAKVVVKSISAIANPDKVRGILKSLDEAASIVAVTVVEASSANDVGSATIEVTVESSSLSRLRVRSVASVVPLVILPTVITSVSSISTAVSSTAVIVTLPVVEPAVITISVPLIV